MGKNQNKKVNHWVLRRDTSPPLSEQVVHKKKLFLFCTFPLHLLHDKDNMAQITVSLAQHCKNNKWDVFDWFAEKKNVIHGN